MLFHCCFGVCFVRGGVLFVVWNAPMPAFRPITNIYIVFLLQFPKTELLIVSLNSQSFDFNFNV